DGSLEIAALASAITGEGTGFDGLGNTLDIGGARIARDQVHDQLIGNEGTDVGVIEDDGESGGEIGFGTLASGNGLTEDRLRAGIVIGFNGNHATAVVFGVVGLRRFSWLNGIGPAGEGAAEVHDVVLGVSGNGLAGSVENGSAVGIELIQTETEQLHDFAGVVLVGLRAGGGSIVINHVEVGSNSGSEGDVVHEFLVVAEGILTEGAEIVGVAEWVADFVGADDPEFVEGEAGALTKLIAAGDGVEEEVLLNRVDAVVGARIGIRSDDGGELVLEVSVEAGLLDLVDGFEIRPEGSLFEEANGGGR